MAWIKNWFSNMESFNEPMYYQDMKFYSVEHFYQAMKCEKHDIEGRKRIAQCDSPYTAKKLGRHTILRTDWNEIKLDVMEYALRHKFQSGTSWYHRLMNTIGPIIENNNWHDNYWGNCSCNRCKTYPGQNHLGKLLMKLRAEGNKNT